MFPPHNLASFSICQLICSIFHKFVPFQKRLDFKYWFGFFSETHMDISSENIISTSDNMEDVNYAYANVLRYVAGFLFKKLITKHKGCSQCIADVEDNLFTTFINLKLYSSDCNLSKPPEHFVKYIEILGDIFDSNYSDLEIDHNIGSKLYKLMHNVHFQCENMPKKYLINLFIRMRIFHIIKRKNVFLKTKIGRDKLKNLNFKMTKI